MKKKCDDRPDEKLLKMYTTLLFSGRAYSLSQLAEILVCSKQTVMRLADKLELNFGLGAQFVRCKKGRESFYRLDRPSQGLRVSINADGLRQLAICRDFMLHLLPESLKQDTDDALLQAQVYTPSSKDRNLELDNTGSHEVSGPLQWAVGLTKGRINYDDFQDIITNLTNAICDRRCCIINYQSDWKGSVKTFYFAPLRLIAYHEALYVRGYEVTKKGRAERVYDNSLNLAVHRMKGVEVQERSSVSLDDMKDASASSFGFMQQQPFKAKLRFSPAVATYVAERIWSDDQVIEPCSDGGLLLNLTASNDQEVISFALSFGENAEVLEPKELRSAMKDVIKKMRRLYKKKQEKTKDED